MNHLSPAFRKESKCEGAAAAIELRRLGGIPGNHSGAIFRGVLAVICVISLCTENDFDSFTNIHLGLAL